MKLQYNNIQRKRAARKRGDEELKKNDRHRIVLYNSNNNKIIRVLHTSLCDRNDIRDRSWPGEADALRQESR